MFNDILGRVKSGNMLKLTPEQRQSIESNYDDQYKTAVNNLNARYKSLQPGADISNNSSYRSDLQDLEKRFADSKANAVTQAEMSMTQEQTQMLSELATLDVYSLAQAAQISVEEANQFKEMLAQMGLMVSGSGQNSGLGALGSMFNVQ